ncbi:aspartyl/glutamyl-tRNA amidotransferase subunit A [Clostridia bacterium]|nr:aspartyl/glutamyl-tRNA amidotransferase subunit A [Clostridia bacterium]
MKDYESIGELSRGIRSGSIDVVELAESAVKTASQSQAALNAFVTITDERAIDDAKVIKKRLDAGENLPILAGIPTAIKDNISTKGIRTTCASNMLEPYVPIYDATVVQRLNDSGAVMLGKLNMDEFAMGSTSETSAFGPVKNPWDVTRSPGGSSGGAAAAVAAGAAAYTLGSDTGGSIRQPAAFCSVTGLKPTYGAVSRYGLIAYGSSLDQIGPIARSARDCAIVMQAIAGEDERDGTSIECKINLPPDHIDLAGLRVGLPWEAYPDGLNSNVRSAVLAAADVLEKLGAAVEYIPFPMLEYAVAAYYIIASAEAASNLSRYDGIRYGKSFADNKTTLEEAIVKTRSRGFGREVKRRLMLGNFVLSAGYYDAYYNKALQAKARLARAFSDAFARYDAILTPTVPNVAPLIGSSLDNPLEMYLSDVYTVPVNLAGLPALSIPCGFADGLPIGAQLIGRTWSDSKLLEIGAAYQDATAFHTIRPPYAGGAK